jgi:DNA-binding CsgD family transcriptional regulator
MDLVGVIEAIYALDRPESEWLAGILEAIEPAHRDAVGRVAYLYDASARPLRVWGFVGNHPMPTDDIARVVHDAADEYVQQSFLVLPYGAASEVPGFDRQKSFPKYLGAHGVRDAVALNAVEPSGIGAWVGALVSERVRVSESEREVWTRVAAHLAAGLRFRLRLEQQSAGERSPVLAPDGQLLDATGLDDVERDRARLRTAVRAMDRARGGLRHQDPDLAVESWRVLVDRRWTLLDRFESDGRRFVVARSNTPSSVGPDTFTRREREVLGYAMLGHSVKLIAYTLGIQPATVRAHLFTAGRKLNARTRSELVQKYRALLAQ